jgi:hypothetical protein
MSSLDPTGNHTTTQGTTAIQQKGEEPEASLDFASLEKSRQVLVFQTIQEAISSVPPRLEATFPSVVSAYTTLTQVVEAAKQGQLSDGHLEKLELDIENAGGVIAPGLWSQGEHSVAAFRAATFGALRKSFSPPVAEAACGALNARLQSLRLNDLGRVFQAIAGFFSPLVPTGSNSPRLQAFAGLDQDRQVLVFRTLQDAIQASPQRSEATFATVVSAFQAEQEVLNAAATGNLSDGLLESLETRIEEAGGVIAPAIFAQGKQSVASFRASTFKALQPLLPPEVSSSAIAALNARLRDLKPSTLGDLFKAITLFFTPLLAQGWNNPTLQSFKALDPQRQTLVFRTIEDAISRKPELETTIFSSAVKAMDAERSVVSEAAAGTLSNEGLLRLQESIEEVGGVIAPGIKASGEGSVGAFRQLFFGSLDRDLPPEVSGAAVAALNAKLRSVPITNLDDVVSITTSFMQPFMRALALSSQVAVPALQEDQQLSAMEQPILEGAVLVPPLEREQIESTATFPAEVRNVVEISEEASPAPSAPGHHHSELQDIREDHSSEAAKKND